MNVTFYLNPHSSMTDPQLPGGANSTAMTTNNLQTALAILRLQGRAG